MNLKISVFNQYWFFIDDLNVMDGMVLHICDVIVKVISVQFVIQNTGIRGFKYEKNRINEQTI